MLLQRRLVRGRAQIIEARVPIIKCCLVFGESSGWLLTVYNNWVLRRELVCFTTLASAAHHGTAWSSLLPPLLLLGSAL